MRSIAQVPRLFLTALMALALALPAVASANHTHDYSISQTQGDDDVGAPVLNQMLTAMDDPVDQSTAGVMFTGNSMVLSSTSAIVPGFSVGDIPWMFTKIDHGGRASNDSETWATTASRSNHVGKTGGLIQSAYLFPSSDDYTLVLALDESSHPAPGAGVFDAARAVPLLLDQQSIWS